MKCVIILIIILQTVQLEAQDHTKEILEFQKELNEEFKNPETSPLKKNDLKRFKGLNFFPINNKFQVEAKFIRTENTAPFKMKTSTDRLPTYEKYGEAIFEIDGKEYKLNIYQSHQLRNIEKYRDYLFLPFTDKTNGEETYVGGRYIDLRIPFGDSIIIDFNKAYHPSCAYHHIYSCPIPPQENHIDIPIKAGIKNL